MAYSLTLGEAKTDWDDRGVTVDAKQERHENAPAFGEPTDYTNSRWPSYSSWADFCTELGITDLMFSVRNGGAGELEVNGKYLPPLIAQHPGHTPIQPEHLEFLRGKICEYKALNPDHLAQFSEDDPNSDGHLCRAEWLDYWMTWALENCERPVFVNS